MEIEASHTDVEARILEQALPHSATVLEAGCGRRTRLAEHRGRITRLVGVDLDTEGGRENAAIDEFVLADLCRTLPFENGSFDLVYSNFVVEHLASPEAAFREWRRVLRPGGSVLLLTTNYSNPVTWAGSHIPELLRLRLKALAGEEERDVFPGLYRANTPPRLTALLGQAGFSPVSVQYVSILHRYASGWPLIQRLILRAEHMLPLKRRSTIVAWYRAA